MNEPARASCSVTSGGAKSLSVALFSSQRRVPYMVRAVVPIVLGFPVIALAHSQTGTDIAGPRDRIYVFMLEMTTLKFARSGNILETEDQNISTFTSSR